MALAVVWYSNYLKKKNKILFNKELILYDGNKYTYSEKARQYITESH